MIAIVLCCLWVALLVLPPMPCPRPFPIDTSTTQVIYEANAKSTFVRVDVVYGGTVWPNPRHGIRWLKFSPGMYEEDPVIGLKHSASKLGSTTTAVFPPLLIVCLLLCWPLHRIFHRFVFGRRHHATDDEHQSMLRRVISCVKLTHDFIAVGLIPIWICGFFIELDFSGPASSGELNAAYVTTDRVHFNDDVKMKEGQEFELVSQWLDSTRRAELRSQLFRVWKAMITEGQLLYANKVVVVPSAVIHVRAFPTVALVLPFLIWPLGRLTHRIVKRKSADA